MLDHMKFAPDPVAQQLGTGYQRFVSEAGVHGLCKVVDDRELHILAISAIRPGTGQFRKFMTLVKAEDKIRAVIFWEVWNTPFAKTLGRYGFSAHEAMEKGEKLTGMRLIKW